MLKNYFFISARSMLCIGVGFLCLSACETETTTTTSSTSQPTSPSSVTPGELTPTTLGSVVSAPELESSSFILGVNIRSELISTSLSEESSFKLNDDEEFNQVADISGDHFVITAEDNSVVLINRDTGELSWTAFLDDISTHFRPPSSPVCGADLCYMLSAGGNLIALDIEARLSDWETELYPLANERSLRISPLLVTENWIVTGFYAPEGLFGDVAIPGRFLVVDRSNGQVVREFDTQPFGTAQSADGIILLPGSREMIAIDAENLDVLWRFNKLADTPAIVNGIAVVSTVDFDSNPPLDTQVLVGLDLKTGEQLWSREAGQFTGRHHPTTDGRLVFALNGIVCTSEVPDPNCDIGRPMAIDPMNGSLIWMNESNVVSHSPTVTAGIIFYGSMTGAVDSGPSTRMVGVDSSNGNVIWSSPVRLARPGLDWLTVVNGDRMIRNSSYPTVKR